MVLNINSGGCIKNTTTGWVTVKGSQSGAADTPATLKVVDDDGLQPNTLRFHGREDADKSHAVIDFDGDVTVGASSGSVRATGYVDIDMQDAADIFQAKEMFVGDANVNGVGDSFAYVTIGSDSGAGELEATALKILAGETAGEHATVELNSGLLDINGELRLEGSTSVASIAEIQVETTGFTATSIVLKGGSAANSVALIDMDETNSLTGDSTDIVADRYSDIDVLSGKTFTVDDFTIESNANTGLVRQIGAGTFDVDVFTMNAPTASITSTFDIADGAIFALDSMDLNGGSALASRVVVDAGENVTMDSAGTSSIDGVVNIDLDSGVVFRAEDLTIFDADTSFQVTGGNSGTISEFIMDSFTNTVGGEIIYRHNVQVEVE